MKFPNAFYLLFLFVFLTNPLRSEEPHRFTPAVEYLETEIKQKAFPGCAVVVGNSKQVLWQAGLGHFDYDEGSPDVTPRTLYDLASLTKVVGTTSVIFSLVRENRLALNDPVVKHLPEFKGPEKANITVEHLLTHSSGLPSGYPFHKTCFDVESVVRKACQVPLQNKPGTVTKYSDIGFILLAGLAERVTKKPIIQLEQELVFQPLQMQDTLRNPPEKFHVRTAPTERIRPRTPPSRTTVKRYQHKYVHAQVHDENARAAGGMTGHAGLFSTATDLSLFARELLRGRTGNSKLFPEPLLLKFTSRRNLVNGSSRALGWDTPRDEKPIGSLFSRSAFGHTGFTGTAIWFDPDRDLYLILLTNRVHPSRNNKEIIRIRRELGDIVVQCIEGRPSSNSQQKASTP